MEILNHSQISKKKFNNLLSLHPVDTMLEFANPDFLKCGSCCTEFLLSDICEFIRHKKKSCCIELNDHHYQQQASQNSIENYLRCSSCSETFKSAYSLLEHAQYFHKINIFINNIQKAPQEIQSQDKSPCSMSSETPLVTPKKEEIFIDVTPSSEDNEQTSLNSNNSSIHKNRSISISSSSPTMSTVSSMSSNFMSLGPFKEPSESKERLYQQKRHSISFDFRDSNQKPKSQSFHFKNGSKSIFSHSSQNLLFQNDNTSSSTDFNVNRNKNQDKTKICDTHQLKNKNNFYPIQNSSSPKQQLDVLDDNFHKRRPSLCGDEKKKKSKQQASFYCDICNAAFNQKIHLTKHSAKHTGIKPFKCSECNYSTVERSHLKVHLRVHTGEKPFKCSFCEYATAQSSTLKIHKKRHHEKLDEPVINKFRENHDTQNEDSLSHSQSVLEIEMENIKSEKNNDLVLNYNDSDFQRNNFNIKADQYNSLDKRSMSLKRSKSYMLDKPKRITNYLDTSQKLGTNRQSFNSCNFTYQNSTEQTYKSGNSFICNLTSGVMTTFGGVNKPKKNNIQMQPFVLNEQQRDAENKLLGLANIALEREIN